MKSLPAFACVALLACSARGQLFNFTTVAGSPGNGSVDDLSPAARLAQPGGVAMDYSGNIYVADTANHTIRRISPDGYTVTFAGSAGTSGTNDGNNALFNSPQGIAVDSSSGNIYVADTGNFTIRQITPDGFVSTLAGSPGVSGSSNGTNSTARFYEPEALTVDRLGNIYVADTWNHTIRKVTPNGVVTTIAGSPGSFGNTDATGSSARFYEPGGITADGSGNLYVADTGNNTIREVTSAGAVITIAGFAGTFGSADGNGTNASFYAPQGIAMDGVGNLYVADSLNNTVRKINLLGAVTTVAGTAGMFGSGDGTNDSTLFWGLQAIAINPTNSNLIYIADTGNSTIRQLSVNGPDYVANTLSGSASIGSTDAVGTLARFFSPVSMAIDTSRNLYVADAANHVIRKMTPAGTISTLAGVVGYPGSADGPGSSAQFNSPQGVAVDGSGNVYVSDTGNSTIRKIAPDGTVSTLAGSPGVFNYFDGTNASALFNTPEGIAVDGSGNVYVADSLNQTIRKVTPGGVVTTLAGYVGLVGSADGTNKVARFNCPTGLAIDGSKNLFVTDLFNHSIRKISPAGVVTTLAGYAGITGTADGPNISALFFEPQGIAVSGTNIYVADSGNDTIRQLNLFGTNWVSSTIAGLADTSGSADGSGLSARFCYPGSLVASGTNLLVADSGNNTIRSGFMISNTPPTILIQPVNQGGLIGSSVTFSVGAIGIGSLYYQWQFNGIALAGATNSSLRFTNIQVYNAGTYAVLISSATGNILSSNAQLTVYSPPIITNQPVAVSCLQGTTVSFNVGASPKPLTYQWLKNGAPVPAFPNVNGATTATLTLSNTTTVDVGTYAVQVSNGYGTVTSTPAPLTVTAVPPPDSIKPYAWWLLNEGSGTVANDYSGNKHTGTLNTGATWTSSGHSGYGVYFNNTVSAQVMIQNPFILTANWSASMWVKRWGSNSASVLIGGTHQSLKLEQYANTNHVGFTSYGVADYALNYVTPLNTWVHLVFVESSAGVSLYANGAFVASTNKTISLDATTLGCDRYTDYLDATLDDVRIYTNVLTAANVANLYKYGRITPIPAVSLTAPGNGALFTVNSNINLTADVVDNGQSVTGVAFYSNGNLLGQVSDGSNQMTWTNVPNGDYLLSAQAVYDGGSPASSDVVGITVAPATNNPTLSLITVENGSLQLSWPPDHIGWSLQAQTNSPEDGLGTNWVTITDSSLTNQVIIPIDVTNSPVFYRMSYP